jgi:hypothetical protein
MAKEAEKKYNVQESLSMFDGGATGEIRFTNKNCTHYYKKDKFSGVTEQIY